MKSTRRKNIFEYSHVKSVSVHVLLDNQNKIRGKIIANWSDNPMGAVCTAQIILFDNWEKFGLITPKRTCLLMGDPTILDDIVIGRAGGGGYDKWSTAIYEALRHTFPKNEKLPNIAGCGEGTVREWFRERTGLILETII